ncbi:SRPBCC family protein [Mycobacterium riyadhense]|uniref:SRPBCC family protein n=1 Tax=Mycobacterium riyadhense TaxID=486698 RepID=UPI00111C3FC0|nr:SRPBCC family protein [Mycobacterium riyadhense]MCV7147294.1 hypothetical protein [Mycobacterium riyadhense]
MNTYENWPQRNHPENVRTYFKDEIDIDAPKSVVWSWLSRPALYPYWYKKWPKVHFHENKDAQLRLGDIFVAYVKGIKSPTEVIDIEDEDTIAWTGKRFGVRGVHSWRLVGNDDTTLVVTEETLRGALPSTFPRLFINAGHQMHQHWLKQLKTVSEITAYNSSLSIEDIHRMSYPSK